MVFTIHQPQSNIVALFDKLILLAHGKVVYSGRAEESQAYFDKIGCACPPGFNIADYLSTFERPSSLTWSSRLITPVYAVDLTMQNEKSSASSDASVEDALIQLDGSRRDPELGVGSPARQSTAAPSVDGDETELETRNGSVRSNASNGLKRFLPSSLGGTSTPSDQPAPPPHIARLVDAFSSSDVARSTRDEIATAKREAARGAGGGTTSGADGAMILRNYKRASWWSQFTILSGRSFKNLYRDPMLMLSHYAVAVIAAGA